MGKYKRRSAPRFLQLHHRLLKSQAWHLLTPLQRCGYIEIAQLYDGSNNGRLAMSVRRLAGVIPCAKNSPILRELEDAGFIETVKIGRWTRKEEERAASEYRLTDFRCDVTGELPTRTYNHKVLWEPSRPASKPAKALTAAERVRRHRRKKRNERNAERPSEWDGSVPVNGTVPVTSTGTGEGARRETAKNAAPNRPDVTLSVPPTGTLIHLTRGTGQKENTQTNPLAPTSRREKAQKPKGTNKSGIFCGSTVTPLKALAPGHSTCKYPSIPSLPAGWHWCRFEKAVVTDTGIIVPVVDDPMVGTEAQREAHRYLRRWVQARRAEAA
jgi:hypothetical protein